MQSIHRRPHFHPLNVHEYSCVVTFVASPVRSFHPPPPLAPYGSFKFRPRVYRNTEDHKPGALRKHAWGACSICSFDASVPLSTTLALFSWVSDTHKTVYRGWKIPLLPRQHALVGLSTSDNYLLPSGGAYYNIRFYVFCW